MEEVLDDAQFLFLDAYVEKLRQESAGKLSLSFSSRGQLDLRYLTKLPVESNGCASAEKASAAPEAPASPDGSPEAAVRLQHEIDQLQNQVAEYEASIKERSKVLEALANDGYYEFLATFEKSPGDALGLDVDWAEMGRLRVTSLQDGLVSTWNAANPLSCVKVGDCIVEVNGVRGDTKTLLDMVATVSNPQIMFAREVEAGAMEECPGPMEDSENPPVSVPQEALATTYLSVGVSEPASPYRGPSSSSIPAAWTASRGMETIARGQMPFVPHTFNPAQFRAASPMPMAVACAGSPMPSGARAVSPRPASIVVDMSGRTILSPGPPVARQVRALSPGQFFSPLAAASTSSPRGFGVPLFTPHTSMSGLAPNTSPFRGAGMSALVPNTALPRGTGASCVAPAIDLSSIRSKSGVPQTAPRGRQTDPRGRQTGPRGQPTTSVPQGSGLRYEQAASAIARASELLNKVAPVQVEAPAAANVKSDSSVRLASQPPAMNSARSFAFSGSFTAQSPLASPRTYQNSRPTSPVPVRSGSPGPARSGSPPRQSFVTGPQTCSPRATSPAMMRSMGQFSQPSSVLAAPFMPTNQRAPNSRRSPVAASGKNMPVSAMSSWNFDGLPRGGQSEQRRGSRR